MFEFQSHDHADQLPMLVGNIYDAAIDSALWPAVLQQIALFVGGSAAALYSKDTVQKTGNVFYVHGVQEQFIHSYFEKYVKLDPFTTTRFFFPLEHVICTKDIMPHEEYLATTFYKEWAKPQGWIDFVSASLEKSKTTYAECGIFRHEREGVTDDGARHRLGLLIGHIRRAVKIGQVIEMHQVKASELADALDGLAAAMFLLGTSKRLQYANSAGHGMLREGLAAVAESGKVFLTNVEADRVLQELIARTGSEAAATVSKNFDVPFKARNGEQYVAHVLPLTSGVRKQAGRAYSASAAVFVRAVGLELPHPIETIAKSFQLTPAEMRVLMAIVEVGGVPEVAPMLGISETTVKSHLKNIFSKTGAARQADLVKLVASYVSPISR